MKILNAILLSLLAFVTLTRSSYAEGGCPPGMIPYSGNNLSSCGPIPPGYYGSSEGKPEALPPEWSSRWGAIATYAPEGILGTSNNTLSEELAEKLALKDCQNKGGKECKLEVVYDNKCAAVVVGDGGYVVTSRPVEDEAVQAGVAVCGGEKEHCHAYYTACSRPVRIQ